jgi:hypothetical protein
MQALLHYDIFSSELRNEQVKEKQATLLEELRDYRENSSVQLVPQIDEMISKVKNLREMMKGETK